MIKYENTDTLPETVEKNKINILQKKIQVQKNKLQIEINKKKITGLKTEISKINNEINLIKKSVSDNESNIASNTSEILNNKITSLNNKIQINNLNNEINKKQKWVKFGKFDIIADTGEFTIQLTDQQVESLKNKHIKFISNNMKFTGILQIIYFKEDNFLSTLKLTHLFNISEEFVYVFNYVVTTHKYFSLTTIKGDHKQLNAIYIYTLEDI